MFVIFDYTDQKYISGLRKNAFGMCNNRFDALHFSSSKTAHKFVCILKDLYPDILFGVLPFEE